MAMPEPGSSIAAEEQITAAWLSATLHAGGWLPAGEVQALDVETWRTKPISVLYRLQATYSTDCSLPERFVLKVARPDIASARARRRRWKEHEFYTRVAPAMPDSPAPRCFAARFDPESRASLLLLADLSQSHGRPPTPLPPAPRQLRNAIDCLAAFHGAWWGRPELAEVLIERDESWRERRTMAARSTVARFMAEFGNHLPGETSAMLEAVGAAWPAIAGRSASPPLTLVHGDAHPWNFLFPHDPDDARARLLDWEGWSIEPGPHDLASLLALYLPARMRAGIEDELLERYAGGLTEAGVAGYGVAVARDDYRRAVARRVMTPVGLWDRGSRARSWWPALERVTAAYSELRCQEVL